MEIFKIYFRVPKYTRSHPTKMIEPICNLGLFYVQVHLKNQHSSLSGGIYNLLFGATLEYLTTPN